VTALITVIVNCGVTASTVRLCCAVCVVGAPLIVVVPVKVTVYRPGVAPPAFVAAVIVAAAPAGGDTEVGLIRHAGVIAVAGVTAHVRVTAPLNPLSGLSRILEAELPPGATAIGEKADACNVKSGALWPDEAESADSNIMMAPMTGRQKCLALIFQLQFRDLDFNMSRV